jgi:branched-chain amino acid aminotransferase
MQVEKVAASRLADADFMNLGFGDVFSDHMVTCKFEEGNWSEPKIGPFEPIPMSPASLALHYGQTVFEGLKAFRGTKDGRVRLFRMDKNADRLQDSCERLCIPVLDRRIFIDAITELVKLDQEWAPSNRGEALYVRPIVIAAEGHLAVRPSSSYMLVIFTSPVCEYFAQSRSRLYLKAEERFTRAAPGGTGYAKTASNYAVTLRPINDSVNQGYDQILWLDGQSHRFVEEAGQMNIFFRLGETVVTPELGGTILPGVTRDSVLTLLKEQGIPCLERRVLMEELVDAEAAGTLQESFGAGTASVVVPIGRINYLGNDICLPEASNDDLCPALYDQILGIQHGELEDRHQWMTTVDG